MKVPSMILAAALCCAGATASAKDFPCYGSQLLDAWKQGHASFTGGRYDKAYATLYPLAENGFAPAQWLVGRMTAEGQGTAKNKVAAWMWLRLAGIGELKLARPYASRLEGQMDMASYDNARRQAENWRPKWSPTCSDDKPWRSSFTMNKNSDRSLDEMVAWWHDLTRDALNRRPDAAPYLLTPPRILFLKSDQNAAVERVDGQIVLLIGTHMRDLPFTEATSRILPAAHEAVNEIALSAVGTAPAETYKGRVLRGHPAADNAPFMDMMRSAIDQSETLPAELKDKVKLIREIRYEPNFTYGASLYNLMGTVFVEDKKLPGNGYLSFRLSPQHQSVANAVLGMVGSSNFAANPGKPDSDAMQCLIAVDKFKAAQVLKLEPRYLQAHSAQIKKRNCGSPS